MSKGVKENQYILVLKNDFRDYISLVPSKEAAAKVAADTLISRFLTFSIVAQGISHSGTHVVNELIKLLSNQAKTKLDFTFACILLLSQWNCRGCQSRFRVKNS